MKPRRMSIAMASFIDGVTRGRSGCGGSWAALRSISCAVSPSAIETVTSGEAYRETRSK
jgi:hypothetical protein